tara:strand:+ start:403 stop:600 length:198 start_codon:yes stop_codon:yes gene_type:complete
MLKKYTKYAATAFAVAAISTFMIGCGADEEAPSEPAEPMTEETPELETGDPEAEAGTGDPAPEGK